MKEIKLNGRSGIVLVDDEDYEFLNQKKWYTSKSYTNKGYAYTQQSTGDKGGRETGYSSKPVSMHRLIMNCPKGMQVDHIDGNSLNNQKSNLRICTHKQNMQNKGIGRNNTSGFKGIRWNRRDKLWEAYIRHEGKVKYLGGSKDIKIAAQKYNNGAIKYFGEFAWLNTID